MATAEVLSTKAAAREMGSASPKVPAGKMRAAKVTASKMTAAEMTAAKVTAAKMTETSEMTAAKVAKSAKMAATKVAKTAKMTPTEVAEPSTAKMTAAAKMPEPSATEMATPTKMTAPTACKSVSRAFRAGKNIRREQSRKTTQNDCENFHRTDQRAHLLPRRPCLAVHVANAQDVPPVP